MRLRNSPDTTEAVVRRALEMPWLYRAARAVIRFLLYLLFRIEISGAERLNQPGGPLLVVTNHLHWLDPPIVFAILPLRATVFAAEKWGVHPIFGPLFRAIGNAIFVNRGEVDRRALSQAMAVLKAGGVLGIAPEGTRSRTGVMQRGRGGAAYLASRTGATILPIGISGQEKAFRTLFQLRRPLIRVVVGEPFVLPGTPNHARGEELDRYTEQIMRRLAELLPPEYRGVYASQPESQSAVTL
ncbi:MAG: lysophospholipid acyltransferase family protein [Anaerolineae bacterium]|nr:1-acyl-sn-glycerol-3-phosphate acyltransferase [Anaerolineae bacterium]MDW8100391.1 lysophospholipid acyltransferase family protein [Anaerolineae bacterium]